MMNAVARRPTPAAQPKPDARALVGNTSDAKICIAVAGHLDEKDHHETSDQEFVSDAALANTIAIDAGAR